MSAVVSLRLPVRAGFPEVGPSSPASATQNDWLIPWGCLGNAEPETHSQKVSVCSLDPLGSLPCGTSQGLGINGKVNIFSCVEKSSHVSSVFFCGVAYLYDTILIMGVPMVLFKKPNYSCLIPLLIQLVIPLSQVNVFGTLISIWKMEI